MIKLFTTGNFDGLKRFLKKNEKTKTEEILEKYAQEGVEALAEATPKRTGLTASSWSYTIEKTSTGYSIFWLNSNTNRNVNIALILQTGHGTGMGTYVQGRDYINPAMQAVFKKMANEIWEEVTGS